MTRLTVIASGKGGVGKTCLAIGLAQALAEEGARVALVDGDLGLANVDVQLGLTPVRDLGHVLSGACTAEEALTPHPAGFALLPGRSGAAGLAALGAAGLDRLVALLRALPVEEVVLDLGAGLAPAQRHLAAAADLLLVVVTEEPTALTDAYAVLKLHRADGGGQAAVVANMVAGPPQAARVHGALDGACRHFLGAGVALLGAVRRDAKVPAAIRAQAPLLTRHRDSPAAQDLRRLAAALRGVPLPKRA
jgi:flagellar biosynthesis protein FlhG